MTDYVVRKMLQYVHDFQVGWLGSDCHAVAEKVRWTNLQRLAFRFVDRNAAASTAMDLEAYVVKLRPKLPQTRAECAAMGQFVCDGTCAGNELGDCNHGDSNDGLQRHVKPAPWFDTCQTIDCQAWPTWRVVDAAGRVVRGSYNCDEHRPQEQPLVDGERYEHRQPLHPRRDNRGEVR